MSEDDLDRYEAELEFNLLQEYKSVAPLFRFAVETERRFYLANRVEVDRLGPAERAGFRVSLHDAWVWDKYRSNRFVETAEILTFQDVNIEQLPRREL